MFYNLDGYIASSGVCAPCRAKPLAYPVLKSLDPIRKLRSIPTEHPWLLGANHECVHLGGLRVPRNVYSCFSWLFQFFLVPTNPSLSIITFQCDLFLKFLNYSPSFRTLPPFPSSDSSQLQGKSTQKSMQVTLQRTNTLVRDMLSALYFSLETAHSYPSIQDQALTAYVFEVEVANIPKINKYF